jgi:septal ring factor EnvC (AmiA/AmiB activator)
MQYPRKIFLAAVLVCSTVLLIQAQTQPSAAERAASLRAQLDAVQVKQVELQTRLQELAEALKPENIQNSLAGIGSTHPEELRAQRRRQLESEKAGVSSQLDQLAASRTRLEAAVREAEANAYLQSARPNPPSANPPGANPGGPSAVSVDNSGTTPRPTVRHRPRRVKRPRTKRS